MSQKPKLDRCSFVFTQDGNTNGSTDNIEQLIVGCESPLGIDNDKGCYYVFKSETGWSVDSSDDFVDIIKRVNQVINFK